MKVVRITDADQIRPLHVVVVCIGCATLAASCLLTSGPHRSILHDGAVEWGPDSALRAVVTVLNLDFSQTTAKGIAVKALSLGLGTSLALFALACSLGLRSHSGDEQSTDDITTEEAAGTDTSHQAQGGKKHIPILAAAQLLMVAFLGFSSLSSLWSDTPSIALGASVLLGIQLAWSYALGFGLNRKAGGAAAVGLVAVLTLTAIMAIAYYAERNSTLRASYPLGNPLFLAACLIPGILIGFGLVAGSIESSLKQKNTARLVPGLVALIAVAIMAIAFYLTQSRGPFIGLVVGLGAMAFFASGGRTKKIVGGMLVFSLVAATFFFLGTRDTFSATGRSSTIRVRLLAWSYALDLGVEAPLVGGGQGYYALHADALAAGEDVLADPQALNARIAHAHNEWLEIWCDLGSVGLVLIMAALAMTLWAGMKALPLLPTVWLRWVLIALLASLVALIVEESANVGLRLPGLPTVYYAVIGLIWAMSASAKTAWILSAEAGRLPRLGVAVVGLAVAGSAAMFSAKDFGAARATAQVPEAIGQLDWDKALNLTRRAQLDYLNPHDRLSASGQLCATYAEIARSFQSEAFRQARQAFEVDPPDERLIVLADRNQQQCVAVIQAGLNEVGQLLKISPSAWNSGVLESRFYEMLASFDQVGGHNDDVRAKLAAAASALEREINRRPYDPLLAASYVTKLDGEDILNAQLDVLARPLRHNPIPEQYLQLLSSLASQEDFDAKFSPIRAQFGATSAEQSAEEWLDPWMPEKLRLSAVILFSRNLPKLARMELQFATQLYDKIWEDAPVGAAACYAELADSSFFADMADPSDAIGAAHRALELAPQSELGRRIVAGVQSRMVTYFLASDQQENAAKLLRQGSPTVADEIIAAELGARYSRLLHGFLQRDSAGHNDRVSRWLERSLQMNPAYEAAWEEAELVTVLRESLNAGADMRMVLAFIAREAIQAHPESTDLVQLGAELRDLLGLEPESSSSQPAGQSLQDGTAATPTSP